MYFLADRSNASIDLFHVQVNPVPAKLTVAAPNQFAGNVPTCAVANGCNGPNGIMTILNPGTGGKELWAGDGPTMTPGIGSPVCPTTCSTVKVFDANGNLSHVISTGGVFRADELCFAPRDGIIRPNGLVLIANDLDSPPYISFIPTDGPDAYQVIGTIQLPTATGGIEQCQWNPDTGRFLLNLPEVSGGEGNVLVINPNNFGGPPAGYGRTFFPVDNDTCADPQGMAIGPTIGFPIFDSTVLLGCNGPTVGGAIPGTFNSVIVRGSNPSSILVTLLGQGGADQVWFDPIALHYFITGGSLVPTQTYGITDARTGLIDQTITIGVTNGTTRRSHSTASWSGSGLGSTVTAAFVPVSATGGTPAPGFQSNVCGFSATQGCIAVFGAVPIPINDTADLD
jgi:hypothetical protein